MGLTQGSTSRKFWIVDILIREAGGIEEIYFSFVSDFEPGISDFRSQCSLSDQQESERKVESCTWVRPAGRTQTKMGGMNPPILY